jgi:queuine tRNA-ribosyltransferase catalytic subunit
MIGDFRIVRRCSTTNARVSVLKLSSTTLELPIFMPVATYGAMKGIRVPDIEENMILANTYHLRSLGRDIKEFMGFKHGMLTDSGGFQIGSLPNVAVEEEGVRFGELLFTPEESMEIQMTLGADIMMQLDEVVNPCDTRDRIEAATQRSIRWLDRCIATINGAGEEKAKRIKKMGLDEGSTQILFPIVQGGLVDELRRYSIDEIMKRAPRGVAIGGLSGGEEKYKFGRTVHYCVTNLPEEIPKYLMGVGYPEDLVICAALGIDMSDCVYPARTARFGRAFADSGDLYFTSRYSLDTTRIDDACGCYTCRRYCRAYLYSIKGTTNFCMLLTAHNLYYIRNLTRRMREAISGDVYPEFIRSYIGTRFAEVPEWIRQTLRLVNVEL